MPWRHFPTDTPLRCADCLQDITPDAGCSHVHIRPDAELGNTYMWARTIDPCYCRCGVSMVNAAIDGRTLNNVQTMPLPVIREQMSIDQPTGYIRMLDEPRHQCSCGRWQVASGLMNATSRYGEPVNICAGCATEMGYRQCAGCDVWQHREWINRYRLTAGTDVNVCGDCVADGYVHQCAHCSTVRLGSDVTGPCCVEDEDGTVLNCQCYPCQRNRGRMIHSYSYRPTPIFGSIVDGQEVKSSTPVEGVPYMGFELEVEIPHHKDRATVAQDLLSATRKRVYLKEDGSISHGFEIVTHPATLDWYLGMFPWQKIRDMRADGDMRSEDSCGLHVHVSRSAFKNASHIYRWLLFFHRNQQIMNLLAGRESTYAEYSPTHRSQFLEVAKGGQASAGRYAAINTNPDQTFEVRIFESTLYVNRIKAALALVEGTVEYTRNLAAGKVLKDGGFSFDGFMAWMMDTNPRRYVDLIRRIEQVTANRTIGRAVRRTDSWRRVSPSGRTEFGNREFVTQEIKTGVPA